MTTRFKFLIITFVLYSISIYADFPEFQGIYSDQTTNFSANESVAMFGEKIYFTFWADNAIRLAVSDDVGENFEYYTVADSVEANKPVICIDSSCRIYIFFQKNNSVKMAKKSTYQDFFQISTFFDKPGIVHSANFNDGTIEVIYSEKHTQALSSYMYITDKEGSENSEGDPLSSEGKLAFWGPDVLNGKLHSNSDIIIQNGGGGGNFGWPTFTEMVTTTGEILVYPNMIPVDSGTTEQVFLGGLETEAPEIYFSPIAEDIRENSIMPIPADVDIVKCVVAGSTGETLLGYIELDEIKDFTVYSWFPDRLEHADAVIDFGGNWFKDADSLWTNHIAIYDTTWVPGPDITLDNQSVFIDCELWIEGNIAGRQTYGCADSVYITGDITYANTIPGEAPDDENNFNSTDYFGLVSEQKIFIKYKHRDPITNEIHDDNTDGIMLYGSYAALAQADEDIYGDLASHYDGTFTFEYQHRHGSTPNFWGVSPSTGQDTLYDYVDLQKWIFPPNVFALDENIQGFELGSNPPAPGFSSSGFPYEDPDYLNSYPNKGPNYEYPYATDYPWYNPVWPESQEELTWHEQNETIFTLFGSLLQTRRGFMGRPGTNNFNHPSGLNEWNLDEYHFGGDHAPTGYDKDYNHDTRLKYYSPPDFPSSESIITNNPTIFYTSNDGGYTSVENQIDITDLKNSLELNYNDENYYLLQAEIYAGYRSKIYQLSEEGTFELLTEETVVDFITSWQKIGDDFYFIEEIAEDEESFNLLSWQADSDFSTILTLPIDTKVAEIVSIDGSLVMVTINANNQLKISRNFAENQFNSFNAWQLPFTTEIEKLSINIYDGELHLFMQEVDNGPTYYLNDNWLEITPNTAGDIVPQIAYQLSNYPNPFNPTTTISFQAKDAEDITIEIFNIRGQKVRQLSKKNEKFKLNEIVWNGKDENGKPVSSGTYIYNLKADNKIIQTNKMVLIK